MPDISVVICACSERRWEDLVEAVDSLRTQTRRSAQTIVVIDHNELLLRHARRELPGIQVVPSSGAPGLSGARNTGIDRARGELVAFLDDDARADRRWLEALTAGFDGPAVIGVGGWVAPDWEGAAPRWLAPELYWIVGCSYRGLPSDVAPIRNAIGANMAFRRDKLLALGGFREDIGQTRGSELRDDETELAIRAHARWPAALIMHRPDALVEHSVPVHRATWRYLVRRCWSEGRGKAVLARDDGAEAALASERTYVRRVLPRAVGRYLRDAVGGDPYGLARATSILAALLITAAGYALGRLAETTAARHGHLGATA